MMIKCMKNMIEKNVTQMLLTRVTDETAWPLINDDDDDDE